MMIEFPDVFHQAELVLKFFTTGKFYKSIKKCLHELKENITSFGYTDKQLYWPWTVDDKYDTLYIIDSINKIERADGRIFSGSYVQLFRRQQLAIK